MSKLFLTLSAWLYFVDLPHSQSCVYPKIGVHSPVATSSRRDENFYQVVKNAPTPARVQSQYKTTPMVSTRLYFYCLNAPSLALNFDQPRYHRKVLLLVGVMGPNIHTYVGDE